MSSFLNSVSAVLVILLLTATGYYCAYRGYLKEEGKMFISKFLLRLCIPFMIIYTFQTSFTVDSLKAAGNGLLACFITCSLNIICSFILMRFMHLPRRQKGVFLMLSAFSNAIFIGYPMCLELFGESCVEHVMVYYMVGTTYTQTLANSVMRYSGSSGDLFSADSVKGLLTTPAIISILIAVALMLLNIRLPELVLTTFKYMSNCVTPLALVLTGYILYSIGLKGLRLDKTIIIALLVRFILSPATALLVCRFLGIDGLLRSVIVVESAMPAPSQTVVFATEYGADDTLAARGCSISTLLSFIEIPLIMLVLNTL